MLTQSHLLYLAIGIALGIFVVPWVLGMFAGGKAAS